MTERRDPQTVSILRAVAGEGDRMWAAPSLADSLHNQATASDRSLPESLPDLLATLALRAVHHLIHNLPQPARESLGIIIGTTSGSLRMDHEFDRSRRDAGARFASPTAFRRTLPSTIAAEISVRLKLRGPLLTLCAGDASTALALRRGVAWLRHFQLNQVIVGGIDWPMPTEHAPATDEPPQVAFLLLSQDAQAPLGTARADRWTPADSGHPRDKSLKMLAEWIRHPASIHLPCGVHLESSNPPK